MEGWCEVQDAWEEVSMLFTHTIRHNVHTRQKDPILEVSLKLDVQTGRQKPVYKPTLQVQQDRTALGKLGTTGSVVWDSGVIAARLFANADELQDAGVLNVKGKTVLELGAGTGIVSMSIAATGASRVIVTDQMDIMKLIQKNFKANADACKGARVEFAELMWGESDHKHVFETFKCAEDIKPFLDFVVASDCVYNDSIVSPLVVTMTSLCTPFCGNPEELTQKSYDEASTIPSPPDNVTKVIIIQEMRTEEVHAVLLEELLSKGFKIWRMPSQVVTTVSNLSEPPSCVVYMAWLVRQCISLHTYEKTRRGGLRETSKEIKQIGWAGKVRDTKTLRASRARAVKEGPEERWVAKKGWDGEEKTSFTHGASKLKYVKRSRLGLVTFRNLQTPSLGRKLPPL
ncbi:putative methyltransferase-domain-containing protein [Chytridium lagenaria]|nr:putative methyltransferase-domain-containing protein [Chytridium lagenaria]